MGGAFQRLVARATGAQTTGLKPRLPTLFETSAASTGFEEVQQETQMLPRTEPRSQHSEPAASTVLAPQTVAAPQPKTVAIETSNETFVSKVAQVPSPLTRNTPAKPPKRAPQQAQPPQLLPNQTPPVSELNTSPPESNRPEAVEADLLSDEQQATTTVNAASPPPPLLQVSELEGSGTVAASQAPTSLDYHPTTRPAQVEAAPPEITIHIGQLDVRSEQPQPMAAQRPAPRTRNLPSLSDYLRGRGS